MRNLFKSIKKPLKLLIVFSILVLGVFLRFNNYSVYPQRGATSDEYTYSFLGVSLLTKGMPISWSYFSAYTNKKIVNIRGITFPIVSPYFDHPPLYGLLVGGWALLFGENTFEKIDLGVIRMIPIFLSIVSSLFVFLIGNKIYGFKVGSWALLIYSTATFFIMNSRVVVAENLLTPLLLASTYMAISSKITFRKIILLGILSGLGVLTKVLGSAIYLTTILFLSLEKRRLIKIVLLSGIFFIFVLVFIVYGFHFNKDLFLAVQGSQSGRNIGPGTLWTYTLQSLIVNKEYLNGWYFFGFFSIFSLFADFKKHKAIILSSFPYFFLLLFSLTQEGHSGWYMIPLYPFMSLATAYVVLESIKKMNWTVILFMIYMGMTYLQYVYEVLFGLTSFQYRLFIILFIVPFIILYIFQRRSIFRLLGEFWFYMFIIGSIISTLLYVHPA